MSGTDAPEQTLFSLTRKTDYALVALARLARQADEAGPPLSARELAQEYQLPVPIMMTVLKELHRGGLIVSRRGVNGGYCLDRPAERITLGEVIDAIEGPPRMALCCEDQAGQRCELERHCPITVSIRRFNDRLTTLVGRLTLTDLLASGIDVPLSQVGLRRGGGDPDRRAATGAGLTAAKS